VILIKLNFMIMNRYKELSDISLDYMKKVNLILKLIENLRDF